MSNQVVTFGCRLNIFESEIINQALADSGSGNSIVFNTCAVTKEAERQAKQAIRKYRRENPEREIIVTGCSAQINPEKYQKMQEVDKVIGNQEKFDPKSYTENQKILVSDIMAVKETASHLISGFEGKSRAFLEIQNGCDHRCTFCIIPYGRGNNRSVPIGHIVSQAGKLVEAGYNEIVLTGVDITGYGNDLPGKPTLGRMIKRLLKLQPGLKRLRLSSIDVAEIDDDLIDLIASEKRLMPHLHLSMQSGDDMILKRMKRRHTKQDILHFCDKARRLRPDIVFGADIITGFPTETDQMFQNTLDVIEQAGITYLHVFPYSAREGTPAAKMPQVPSEIRKERARILRQMGEKAVIRFLETKIGKVAEVIIEKENSGHTEHFARVQFEKSLKPGAYKPGELVKAIIKAAKNNYLIAA